MADLSEELRAHLFEPQGASVFAVLDGASVPRLLERLYTVGAPEWECLYRGKLEPDMAHVAPYLVRLEAGHRFSDWVLSNGWGNHWGIFATSEAQLFHLRQHFRRFLRVYSPEGQPLYFRYYDPRVLRTYLPTCNAQELIELFGTVITSYVMDDEDGTNMLRFSNDSGKLKRVVRSLKGKT